MAKILMVEDNPLFCDYVCNYLAANTDLQTERAYNLSQARKQIATSISEDDVVLADLRKDC